MFVRMLSLLNQTHEYTGTGLLHESFWYNDPSVFTREWFAMANSLFGEATLSRFQVLSIWLFCATPRHYF